MKGIGQGIVIFETIMLVSTTRCKDYNHPEFVLDFDETAVPHQHVSHIIQTIERMVAQGSAFASGETFQIGWMITQIQQYDKERLTLFEPDMRTIPMVFVAGVTATLRQMMYQLFFIDSLAVPRNDIRMPSVRQSAVVCTRYAGKKSIILTSNDALHASDSGWFIGCLDDDHDHMDAANLACVSLFEAFLNCNQIQDWMAFPAGTLIALNNGKPPKVFRDGEELSIVPESFLARLIERQK